MSHSSAIADCAFRQATFLATDRLAARQWELYLAGDAITAGRRAWQGPVVLAWRAWIEELWSACGRANSPLLLSPLQSRALWRRVIGESPQGERLLGTAAAVRWSADAWRRLAAWRIDLGGFSPDGQAPDFAAFLAWSAAFRQRLVGSGWIDAAQLEERLARAGEPPGGTLVLAGLEPTAAEAALISALRARGVELDEQPIEPVAGRAWSCRLADPTEELRAAGRWAGERLADRPGERVAIVVTDLGERAGEVRRVLAEVLAESGRAPGMLALHVEAEEEGVDASALRGAALNAIELLSPRGGHFALSRWLRSPFFQGRSTAAAAAAARLEVRLRGALAARLPFESAYRRGGLREAILAAAPELAEKLDAGLDELGPTDARRTPAAWACTWPRVLHRLGWAGWDSGEAAHLECRHWERALGQLASLTPITGEIGLSEAVGELESLLGNGGQAAPLPLAGVHVLADIADVGPGYAGIWVTGALDGAYPRPVQLNPLLPRRLQVEHAMPWCSPQDALRRSRTLIGRLIARAYETIFSWPASIGEEAAEPSPLIRALPRTEAGEGAGTIVRRRSRRETLDDPAPPMQGTTIHGGTAALNVQAVCPLRAFCEYRLAAPGIDPQVRGLTPRLRGVLLHGALERLLRRFGSRAALAAARQDELETEIRRAAEAGAAAAFGAARAFIPALFELEVERIAAALGRSAAGELQRAPFRVRALEQSMRISVRGRAIDARIDRIDELQGGGLAIIDYKSGRTLARASDWLAARPREVQVPLYALALAERARIAALVIAALGAERVVYTGLWRDPDAFPGRSQPLPDDQSLEVLVEKWGETIGDLVEELAGGDTRFFAAEPEPAAGAYAPLTRIREQSALHRGWLEAWR